MAQGPAGMVPYRNDGIAQLILNRGNIYADQADRSGQMWANLTAGLGQHIGGAIQQNAIAKEEAKKKAIMGAQDEAFLARVSDTSKPPITAAEALRIYGPDRGTAIYKGYMSLQSEKPDLKSVIAGFDAASPQMRAQAWPAARQHLANAGAPPELLPQEWDEGWYERFKAGIQEKGKAPEPFTLTPGQVRFGPDGKPIANVPAAPKEVKKYEVTVPGPGGVPIKKLVTEEELAGGVRQYEAPRESKEPKVVQVETVGPDGKPVTQFVTPTAGASYPKPTGAGKASTGQQKRALNFFNRAKEAAEIVDSLETGKKLNPTALKYVPDVANFLLSDENQAYRQAQRAFTEARLRKESGAAIKDEEYESDAVKYFNQPGDSEATKAQKRAGRNAVLAGIAFESGDALKEFYGDESEGLLAGLKESGGGGMRPMTSRDFSVKAPDGKTYTFNSAAELDGFKKRAGIR